MNPCSALGKASGVHVEALARDRSPPERSRAGTEQRAAGSYEAALRRLYKRVDGVFKRLDGVFERLELLSVMVGQAYHGYLLHTPEFPLEREEVFVASAADRYAGYEEMVATVLARGGLELAKRLNEGGDRGKSCTSSEESSEE